MKKNSVFHWPREREREHAARAVEVGATEEADVVQRRVGAAEPRERREHVRDVVEQEAREQHVRALAGGEETT